MKLIDHFPSWATDGLFSKMTWAPWYGTIPNNALDIEYFGNHSGERESSPLLDKMSNQNGPVLSTGNTQRLLDVIQTMHGLNWNKLWYAIQLEYNPIENYNSVENRTLTGNDTESGTTNTSVDRTSTTINNTDEEMITGTSTVTTNSGASASVVPLNGNNPVKLSQTDEDGESTTTSRTDTHDAYTDSQLTEGSDTDTTHNKSIARSEDYTLTRKGNIGVTTSQQMLESEYELRKRNYFNYVFECVDEILTIPYWR